MKSEISSVAAVHPGARMARGVTVAEWASIGEHVEIGEGTTVGRGVIIEGRVTIGRGCQIFPYAIIGTPPQDTNFRGEASAVIIGDHNIIREFVTIHRATGEGCRTLVGHDNFIMAYAHIAHNCVVGDGTTLVNGATLGGHVVVEDRAVVSAFVAVHQHVRVGTLAMLGAVSKPVKDIPPYVMIDGRPMKVHGLNVVGLERDGVSEEAKKSLKQVYKIFYRSSLTVEECLTKIELEVPSCSEVQRFVQFVRESKIGVYRATE